MTVADWSPEWKHWIVTAQREGRWTLVGVFREAAQAFRAVARAKQELSAWEHSRGSTAD